MGQPITQMPYQTVGDLHLDFPEGAVTDYCRELDLLTTVARVTYVSEGVEFAREAFISAVDEVFVLRLTANQPGKITFTAAFGSPQQATVEMQGAETLALHGIAGEAMGIAGVTKFTALAKVVREGGTIHAESDQLIVANADAVTLFVSLATGYKNYADVSADANIRAREYLEAAASKPYPEGARSGGVYPNLLDAHPPFQIDGNFGFTAGVAEMLLQSHAGEIHLLPALPTAWKEGSVHGLVARGNATADIHWSEGALTSATLLPRYTGPFTIRYKGKTLSVNAIANEAIALTADHFIA